MAKLKHGGSHGGKSGKNRDAKALRENKSRKSKASFKKSSRSTSNKTKGSTSSKTTTVKKKFKKGNNSNTGLMKKKQLVMKKRKKSIEDNGQPELKKPKLSNNDGSKKVISNKKGSAIAKKPSSVPSMRRERETSDEMKETIKRAKNMWEKLRRHDLNKDDRAMLLTELMELIRDNLFDLVKKHDTARVIQSLLRFGAEDTRLAVMETLKEHIVELSKLKYAKFVVKSLFKYCKPTQRAVLISMLYNNVIRLIKHTEASEIVELAYNEYANATQRALLTQEFYGPQFALFKDTSNSGRSLGEILAENPDQREKLIGHIKRVLLPLMNKVVVKHSIIHKVLLDFLLHADEKSQSEVIEGVREVVVEMLHTREGAKVALNCLWHGNAKDRKTIVKSFKTFVAKICKEEHGHLVLMGVFDCVDDTVLVNKTLISEMISSLDVLCADHYGRRVLLYLLTPRSSQHFTNQFVQLLTPGDGNTCSKKPQNTRWAELRSGISQSLISLATDKAAEWACQKPMAPLLIQIALSASGDVSVLYDSVIKGLEISDMVCDPCGHWVLKRLISSQPSFATLLLSKLSDDTILSWMNSNRGCFVLTSLLKNDVSRTRVSNIIRPFLDEVNLSEDITQGMKVLVKTLQDL